MTAYRPRELGGFVPEDLTTRPGVTGREFLAYNGETAVQLDSRFWAIPLPTVLS